jgi:hypothetical protein
MLLDCIFEWGASSPPLEIAGKQYRAVISNRLMFGPDGLSRFSRFCVPVRRSLPPFPRVSHSPRAYRHILYRRWAQCAVDLYQDRVSRSQTPCRARRSTSTSGRLNSIARTQFVEKNHFTNVNTREDRRGLGWRSWGRGCEHATR